MKRATVVTALAGALLALAIVGGFMALDRTVLHWYAAASQELPPTPTPTATGTPTPAPTPTATGTPTPTPTPTPVHPNFSEFDVLQLVQSDLAGRPFPGETRFVICLTANYRSGNKTWIVRCGFYTSLSDFVGPNIQPDRLADHFISLIFNDETGRVVR